LTSCQIAEICRQVLEVLHHLHIKRIIHGDVKSENLILAANGSVKLIDFGFARWESGSAGEKQGTPCFMAPEIIRGEPASVSADIWAFGIMLFEMCTGYVPYQDQEAERAHELILSNGALDIPDTVDPELTDLLDRCLQVDPSKRASAADLLLCPVIQNYTGNQTVQQLVKTFRRNKK